MYLPLVSNDPHHEKNYNKRIKYAENYRAEHPLDIQEVAADEIRALKDYELLFLFLPARMGSADYVFALMQDGKLKFYRTDWSDHDWFWAIKDTFPLFDHLREITAEPENDDHNYERKWVYIWYWGWVLVWAKIFDDFYRFVEFKRNEFWFDAVSWTRYHSRDVLAKMYYDSLEAR